MARSDQRTRLTRMLIRQAFTSLLKEKPVQSISVKELCERAGINRGTFYAHYTDIYDLMRQMEDEMMADIQTALRPLLDSDTSDLTPLKITTGIFRCLKENADRATPKQIEYYYSFVSAGCIGLLEKWLADGMADSAEELASAAENIMMKGIHFLA